MTTDALPRRAVTTIALTLSACASSPAAAPTIDASVDVSAATPQTCDAERGTAAAVGDFTRWTIDDQAPGPGYVSIGDLDGDGRLDVLVSSLGAVTTNDDGSVTLSRGHLTIYFQGPDLACWRKRELLGDDDAIYFPNQTTLADLDGDGDLDVVAPSGFFVCQYDHAVQACGALDWFENVGGGFARHSIVAANARFFHKAIVVDFDGDGTRDLVTVSETGSDAQAEWFEGDASSLRFSRTPRVIGAGGGSLPVVADVDGDGDLDVVSAQYFEHGDSFVWFERTAPPSADAPAGTFVLHTISPLAETGRAIMVDFAPNLFGDGKTRLVATNHTNPTSTSGDPPSAAFVFDVPSDPTAAWPRATISSGITSRPNAGLTVQSAPGVFGWGDVDGDGDLDVALAGDGDIRTFWLEQTSPGSFTTHTLEAQLGQAAGGWIGDLDGDGRNEIVFVGYEAGAVYVYRHR